MRYGSAAEVRRSVCEGFRPAERISVSEGINRTLVTKDGPYSPELSPYMAQPADRLDSRKYRAVVFIGPGRCSKTATLIDGWAVRNIRYAPGDMLIVQSSQDLARYYSKQRFDKIIKASPKVRERLSTRRQDDNTYDKVFRNMVLAFGWPSGAQLSGRDFRYVAITEYDLAADDIDEEGSLFTLGSMRTQSYMSAGMTVVETSIRRVYTDAQWRPNKELPHEAPPAGGATLLYNMGTRNWLYWQCRECREFYPLNPDVHVMFGLDPIEHLANKLTADTLEDWVRHHACIACPHCGAVAKEDQRRALNKGARWVPDGCRITPDGEMVGQQRETDIDSYQLSCVAAGYAHWPKLLRDYGVAILEYQRTGLETGIKETVNLHQGRAYLPFALQGKRKAGHELQKRAEEQRQGYVPRGVRFLTASVDVQAGKRAGFVVKVLGWGPHREHWTIDRFHLRHSEREGEDGQPLLLDPAGYVEDWQRLVEKAIQRRYPLEDGSGRTMPVRVTLCDSGGEDGVTSRAYEFWRQMAREGMGHKFRLVKGANSSNAPRVEERRPDARGNKQSNSGATGDVPVLFINTDQIKDTIAADLKREEPGPGFWHFASWMPTSAFEELTAETRTAKGWVNASKRHNEELDLCVYGEAAWIALQADKINWDNPPPWARDWDENPDVRKEEAPEPPKPAAPRPPRVVRSNYLRR